MRRDTGSEVLPVEVFVSYSHVDGDLRKALGEHLLLLKRQQRISVWHDRRNVAGALMRRPSEMWLIGWCGTGDDLPNRRPATCFGRIRAVERVSRVDGELAHVLISPQAPPTIAGQQGVNAAAARAMSSHAPHNCPVEHYRVIPTGSATGPHLNEDVILLLIHSVVLVRPIDPVV